jgi:pre-mRNA-splicing helicase BRR2
VIKSVVDEILAVLKNENNKDSDRKAEVEGFVGRISSEFFSDLLLNSKLITDYNPQAADAEKFEEEVRMPVVFDEPQKEASSEEEYVVEEGDDDSAEEERQAIKVKEAEMEVEREDAATHVNATDIDAYWLHAAINQVYNDPIRT